MQDNNTDIPDYVPSTGKQWIKAEELEGERFVVHSFVVRENDFEPGKEVVDVNVEIDGQRWIWTTGATAIRHQLEEAKLPFRASLIKRQGKRYRYWSFA